MDYDREDIPRYATVVSWTADFGDGYEMDIMVCSDDDDQPLWCQAVLYHNGGAAGFIDGMDDLLDEFDIEGNNGTIYVVEVQAV